MIDQLPEKCEFCGEIIINIAPSVSVCPGCKRLYMIGQEGPLEGKRVDGLNNN